MWYGVVSVLKKSDRLARASKCTSIGRCVKVFCCCQVRRSVLRRADDWNCSTFAAPAKRRTLRRTCQTTNTSTNLPNREQFGAPTNRWKIRLLSIYCHLLQFLVSSCHSSSFLVICSHVLSFLVICCHFLPFLAISRHFLSALVISFHFVSFLAICRNLLPFLVIDCHILSFLVISFHFLSFPGTCRHFL